MGLPTFDIEAMDWTDPIAVGFTTNGVNYREFLKTSPDTDVIWAFLDSIKEDCFGMAIYAHNAGNYDNKFILDSLIKHGQKIKLEAGLGRIVWLDHEIFFEDSLLVVGTSLKTLCSAFDVPRKLEWDHETTKDIWDLGARLDSFRAYLKRDVISLSIAMEEYCKGVIRNFGVTPGATLSLTAVKAFNNNFFPVKAIHSNEEFEKFIRLATYGGRNEVYHRIGEDLNLYDIRSMFISCYDTPIPIGEMDWRSPKIECGSLAEAKVEVPKGTFIGPLPYRIGDTLAFPTGRFKGWWDMVDLRRAETSGTKVKLLRQLECEEVSILKDFGEYVSALRYSSPNLDQGKLWKLFGIRLSGKFGQHRWRTEIVHSDDIIDFNGYTPLDISEEYHERAEYLKGSKAPYVKPAVAMRIRAEARGRHYEFLTSCNPYYCDTDSIHTTEELPLGSKSGELQLIGKALRAYYIRCKLYGYVDLEGHMKQRAAGFHDFRLTEYDFQRLLQGEDIEHTTKPLNRWRQILAQEGMTPGRVPRRARGLSRSDNRVITGIDTEPIHVEDW